MLAFSVVSAAAQNQTPPPEAGKTADDVKRPDVDRPNLLLELGLSREQIRQIRRINADRKPLMEQAQRTMREAVRALDTAIYADTVNDSDVTARVIDFQTAQAEVARIRFESELAIRKILTPDQLVRFREVRRRFEEARKNTRRLRRNRKDPTALPLITRPGAGRNSQ
ncbi:MAG TPA: periplasmic heavy metal sensor [Pyrinomonadaceae bacterium]|nr:periplasmic heavy metal sensor [Pyrinomonadaceae bacterium]